MLGYEWRERIDQVFREKRNDANGTAKRIPCSLRRIGPDGGTNGNLQ